MPAPRTLSDFASLLQQSRLLKLEQFDRFLADPSDPSDPDDQTNAAARQLAGKLIQARLLTHFQAKQLLNGKHRGFFYAEKYKVLEHIGSGGMGNVFLCEHLILQRLVAVKMLNLGAIGGSREGIIERFYREARAVAALDHTNIVHVYDVDAIAGAPYMVMEFVDGVDLHHLTARHHTLSVAQAADYVRQAADGLQHAHESGLIHRDIKPGNILLDRTGVVKVVDLGLARFRDDLAQADNLTHRFDRDAILGTADFISPEQASGGAVDIRADLYSLGCTFYYLLTGRMVFEGGTVTQKLLWQQTREPDPVSMYQPSVPSELERIVQKLMAKDPDERFQTPAQLARALAPFAIRMPPTSADIQTPPAETYLLGLAKSPTDSDRIARKKLSAPSRGSEPNITRAAHDTGPLIPPSTRPKSGTVNAESADPAAPTSRRLWRELGSQARTYKRSLAIIGGIATACVALLVTLWPAPNRSPIDNELATPITTAQKLPIAPLEPRPIVKPLRAGGSSFIAPLMNQWARLYERERGVPINYESIGSGSGVKGLIDGTFDFACSDAFLSNEQLATFRAKGETIAHIPLVMGAVTPTYNLPARFADLKLTGPVLAEIYLGRVTRWNAPAIGIHNPGVSLPDLPIRPIYRSDSSGTTFIFTDYLSKVSSQWRDQLGRSNTMKWPVGEPAKGNDGVADAVSRINGSIGYVELSYALGNNLPITLVKNREGEFLKASLESVTAAAESSLKTIPDDFRYSLTDADGKESYPIVGTTWALVRTTGTTPTRSEVVPFLEWATHDGQRHARPLRFATLSDSLILRIDALFYRLGRK